MSERIRIENIPHRSAAQEDEEITNSTEESELDQLKKRLAEVEKRLKIEPPSDGKLKGEEMKAKQDEDIKKILFADSTHRLLFMTEVELPNGESHTVNRYDWFMALAVIAWQYVCYVVFFHLVRYIEEEDFTTPSGDEGIFYWISMFVPVITLGVFLLPDLFASSCLVRCGWASSCHYAKVTGILIDVEAILAILVASAGCIAWGSTNRDMSSLDMFSFVVGVVFIHDVDEKVWLVWAMHRQVEKRYKNFAIVFWIVWLMIFFGTWWGLFDAFMGSKGDPNDFFISDDWGWVYEDCFFNDYEDILLCNSTKTSNATIDTMLNAVNASMNVTSINDNET